MAISRVRQYELVAEAIRTISVLRNATVTMQGQRLPSRG